MKKILFFAVHPDDETLGCGGTILKHKANNDQIYWVILTKANLKITTNQNFETIQKQYVSESAQAYNFNEIFHLDFLTTELDTYPLGKIVEKLSTIISNVKPDVIYIPNRSDIHSDHKVAFEAIMSCTKSFRYPFITKILMYETLSETEFSPSLMPNAFVPNYFVDISLYLSKKMEIMKLFTTEQMEKPYPRSLSSIEALARYRGSRIGTEYAEAFVLLYEKC